MSAVGLAGGHPGERAGQQVQAENLAVPAQRVMAGRGQPDQRAPPVGRVVLALEQPLILQVAHDLADNRLGAAQVRGRLTDRQRSGYRQVLKHGPRRASELAPRPVPAVKRQVHGPEPRRELLGPLPLITHAPRLPLAACIVNPDGLWPGPTTRVRRDDGGGSDEAQ